MKDLPSRIPIGLAWTVVVSAFAAITETDLPDDTSFPVAFGFWFVFLGATVFLILQIDQSVTRLLGGVRAAAVLRPVITIALVTVPATLLSLALDPLTKNSEEIGILLESQSPFMDFWPIFLDEMAPVLPNVALVWAFFWVVDAHLMRARNVGATATAAPALPDTPDPAVQSVPLFRRHPELGQRQLLAIEAQEHYIKVYTDQGADLILYRFNDAVEDLKDYPGLRVHRSFWIANAAVTEAVQDGRRVFLQLVNGLRIPVSQSYLLAARKQGLVP